MMQLFQMDFAYSRTMQIILACMSFGFTFLCHYMISTLVLTLYGDNVSPRRRMLFSFLTGTLLNDVWVYGIYFIGGMVSFSPLVYAIVTVPNPFMALLYYYFGLKALRLSPTRSIRIMCHTYLYVMAYKSIVYLVNYQFFNQSPDVPYNYMIDACSLVVDTALSLVISGTAILLLRKKKFVIDLRDTVIVKSVSFELLRSFMLAAVSYLIFILPRLDARANQGLSYLLAAICGILIFLLNLLWDVYKVTETKRANKAAYVTALVKSTDDIRTFRHDFKNVLQTYGGYIMLNDMDRLREYHESVVSKSLSAELRFELTRRMEECPPIISVLLEKLAYAEQLGVDFQLIPIERFCNAKGKMADTCRCLGSLLDNAIESAADSERKMVLFSIERKENGNCLIVITNSTREDVLLNKCCEPGFTTKQNHIGLGLTTVRRIIDKNANCTLNLSYYLHEFSVYLEIRESDVDVSSDKYEDARDVPVCKDDKSMNLPDQTMNEINIELDFATLTILIVDDNTFLIDTVKKYLESLQVTVDTAENGLAGVELYRNNPDRYDIVFLDITMPVMNGIEAAGQIRETNHPSAQTVPLIAITGNLLSEQFKMQLFDGILHKPFEFNKIEKTIRQYIK